MIRIAFVVIFLCAISSAHADTLNLKDGREIEGRIINETDEFVTVEIGDGVTNSLCSSYRKSNILSIEKGSDKERDITTKKTRRPEAADSEIETMASHGKSRPIASGMSKKEVLNARGAPAHIRKSESSGIFYENWIYDGPDGKYTVHFENGTVKTWADK